MKSVGEVMAIGRTFQESLQKALRGLETGLDGLEPTARALPLTEEERDKLAYELRAPGPNRLLYVADAFRAGWSVERIQELSYIDPWFLAQIEDLIREEAAVRERRGQRARQPIDCASSSARASPTAGSAKLTGCRARMRSAPSATRSTSARCTSASTPARRSSRRRPPTCTRPTKKSARPQPTNKRKIMILGGGPNRIGQGIEFDYCCVHAALQLREDGFETIMVNCNPETVSTDYDTSDRLYFEPLTFEDVLEVIAKEKPEGVIVQYGGQTPLKLSRALEAAGAPIIGTVAGFHRHRRRPRALPACS